MVSLPSKWVRKYEAKKGDELEVTEDQNILLISTDSRPRVEEVEIDITGLDRTSIMYVIRSLYRLGYDTVKVHFRQPLVRYQRTNKDINTLSVIHTEVNRLIGYEIIQEKEGLCVIKDLQETSAKDFDQVLRRLFMLLDDAGKDFITGVKNNDLVLLETIEEKHDTITKFVSYCLRLLNKRGHQVLRKTAYYHNIIASIDRITDIIKYAARDLRSYDKKLRPEVIRILEGTMADIAKYHELFYKYENKKIVDINSSRYSLEKDLRNMTPTVKPTEIIVATNVFHILEILLDLIEARTALEY
jgi:phosphate uptake regulator